MSPLSTLSSISPTEISHFTRLSSRWWTDTKAGEFALLHKMNPVRVRYIREKVLEVMREEGEDGLEGLETELKRIVESARPFEGMKMLDVGCGGGLLAESLARLGAHTLAIDAAQSNIHIASLHASQDPHLSSSLQSGRLRYEYRTAESLLSTHTEAFDTVCAMEVLEHVENPADFLRTLARLVKPGGHLFLSTVSRTPLAYFLTIFAAEQLLRLVEPGTHTYSKFVKPSELVEFFSKPLRPPISLPPSHSDEIKEENPWIARLYSGEPTRREAEVRGIIYVPVLSEWRVMPRGMVGTTECNYIFWARKPKHS